MTLAQQMMKETGGFATQAIKGIGNEAPVPAPDAGTVALLTPAQVAQILGVGETDVMASLESGDLKGKKIGSQWRITRAAVDVFLAS